MSRVINSTFIFILIVEFIIGNLGNGFIALVNCVDWVKRRKISLADQILTALAISRIVLLCLIFFNWYVSVFNPALLMYEKISRTLLVFWTVVNHFSIWLATSLSVFYFLKIANFSNLIFFYLKRRVKKVVSVILLVTLVLLFLNIALVNIRLNAWINGYERNRTCISISSNFIQFSSFLLFTNIMFIAIPFTLSLTTFILLISSLWKHVKKMQHGAKGSGDVSTTVHIKAMQAVITFLLLYALFFLSYFMPIWSPDLLEKNAIITFWVMLGTAYPSVHSCVLILHNSKLRQASLSVLWWLRCMFKDGEPLGHTPFRESS
ncbi:taste receptor type 2 member 14 [Microcebus murinus]|uniref:taste receptor type 2 member 14 n=1 Tax=Microcebus murinus TaxID=30608 RepID=UPI003F6CF412